MNKRWAYVVDIQVFTVVEQETKPDTILVEGSGGFWVEALDWVGPDCTYENGQFKKYTPPPLPNIITKVAFRFRMTDQEYVGILSAAKTDVEVTGWVETFNMVSQIDLDDQRTKDGVENLVSKNLLTQVRANEILTAPVQPNERPV